MDKKDKRIKDLEKAAMKLFDMVHQFDINDLKIKANDLYDVIIPKEDEIVNEHLWTADEIIAILNVSEDTDECANWFDKTRKK